jgi:hypothetical protein
MKFFPYFDYLLLQVYPKERSFHAYEIFQSYKLTPNEQMNIKYLISNKR